MAATHIKTENITSGYEVLPTATHVKTENTTSGYKVLPAATHVKTENTTSSSEVLLAPMCYQLPLLIKLRIPAAPRGYRL